VVFRREGKPECSLALVDEAIRQHPQSAVLYFARGLIEVDAQAARRA
jgi:hypothetical protein